MTQSRILIADDDTGLLQALTVRLSAEGYEIFTAQDGYQAVEYARSKEPDLILLDVNMPAGDGFSVQERLRKMGGRSIPVIYLTGETSRRVDEGAQSQGAFAVIHKPFDTADLLGTIRSALGQSVVPDSHAA